MSHARILSNIEHRDFLFAMLKQYSCAQREVTLSSGATSSFYIDCKASVLQGRGHYNVGRCLDEALVQLEVEGDTMFAACAGLTMGADPLCSALSLTCFYDRAREFPALYVRKEPKAHGTNAWIEGNIGFVPAPDLRPRVLLLEDVITTGKSALLAVERLRDAGYTVDTALALVDRQEENGADNLRAHGVEPYALFNPSDFK